MQARPLIPGSDVSSSLLPFAAQAPGSPCRPHPRLHEFSSESLTVREALNPTTVFSDPSKLPARPPGKTDPAPELIQSSRPCYKLSCPTDPDYQTKSAKQPLFSSPLSSLLVSPLTPTKEPPDSSFSSLFPEEPPQP